MPTGYRHPYAVKNALGQTIHLWSEPHEADCPCAECCKVREREAHFETYVHGTEGDG